MTILKFPREEISHASDIPWDGEQLRMAKIYKKLVMDAFDQIPNNGKFYFKHAAAVLRQCAEEWEI